MSAYQDYFDTLSGSSEKTNIDFGFVNRKRVKRKNNYLHPNQLRTMKSHPDSHTNHSKQNDLLGAIEMLVNPPPPILPISDYLKQTHPDSVYGSGKKKPFIINEAENIVKKGFHKMPDGTIMPDSDMPKPKPKKPIDPINPITPGTPIKPKPVQPVQPVQPKPKPIPKPKKQFVPLPLPPGARYVFPNNKVPKKSTIVKGSKLTDKPDGTPYIPKPKPIIPVKPKTNPDAPIVVKGVRAPPMGSVEGDPGYKKPFFSGGQDINWMPKTGRRMIR